MSHIDPVAVLHGAVLASPGGIAGAAELIGRSAQVLYNKFSESMPNTEISAREALAISLAIHSQAYAQSVAQAFGGVFLALPTMGPADDDVLASYLEIVQRMGQLSQDFIAARADGVIDPSEFRGLQMRGQQTCQAIMQMLAELELIVREIPPAVTPLAARRVG